MSILPQNRPQLKKVDAENKLATFSVKQYPVKILGVRGYFKRTMGNPESNDVGIYDDAIFIVSDDHFSAWNANTDPSRMFTGVAVLKPGGPYLYKKGIHGIHNLDMKSKADKSVYDQLIKTGKDVQGFPFTYWAFRQYGNVTVLRGGKVEVTDSPANRFYIDIHRGGANVTSSEGCQTIPPSQWQEFFQTALVQMAKRNQNIIPYVLIEG